jgi:predicted dithiol-disulfide oxidoreductase (DUF899 family)
MLWYYLAYTYLEEGKWQHDWTITGTSKTLDRNTVYDWMTEIQEEMGVSEVVITFLYPLDYVPKGREDDTQPTA